MQKLKSFIIRAVNRNTLDIYKQIDPTAEDFSLVIHSFETLSASKKSQFQLGLLRKLQRQHKNSETLNLLILCDFLSATNPDFFSDFPNKMLSSLEAKKKVRVTFKQQKIKLAETSFNCFYLQYLRQKVWGVKNVDNITISNLEQGLIYCDSSITALKLVISHDFIIDYALSNSQHKNQIKIALENILRRSAEDLTILIRFVDKWNHVILENKSQSVMVNDIYEQLIYVSKNISKLQYLNNKIKGNIKFPRYELKKELNLNIQKSMINKEGQRKSFYCQRRIKTEGDLDENHAEITESEIYMKIKM